MTDDHGRGQLSAPRGERDLTSLTERQRHVVEIIEKTNRTLTVDELADRVQQFEKDTSNVNGVATWEKIHQDLTCADLPALARRSAVDFRADQGIVSSNDDSQSSRATPLFRSITSTSSALRSIPRRHRVWISSYLILWICAIGLFELTQFDVWVFDDVSILLTTGVIVAAFVGLSLVYEAFG